MCRSVCEGDQNWIKQSKPFLRTNQGIKIACNCENQRIMNMQLQFGLWPIKIKWSRASEGNDQAIKHDFCWSKILQATYKWLLLDMPSKEHSSKWNELAVCEWIYVTRWDLMLTSYVCWLHWSTWVAIQSLQTLRYNGYLSLGKPNPA